MARVQQYILKIFLDYCMFHNIWGISFTKVILQSSGGVHYLLVALLAKTRCKRTIKKISKQTECDLPQAKTFYISILMKTSPKQWNFFHFKIGS